MENTLYFKDMRTKDHNDYPSKIYKVEYSRMFIEILDNDHIHGKPHYFGSPRLRDDFINNIKALKNNHKHKCIYDQKQSKKFFISYLHFNFL